MGRILIMLVAVITMGTAAHATTLAAGLLYGGVTQETAVCYVYNAGDSTVSVSEIKIIAGNVALPLVQNTCGTLAAGGSCFALVRPINRDSAHACKAVVPLNGANVRGTLDIRTGANDGLVLQTEQLR